MGGLIGVLLIVALIWFLFRRKKQPYIQPGETRMEESAELKGANVVESERLGELNEQHGLSELSAGQKADRGNRGESLNPQAVSELSA